MRSSLLCLLVMGCSSKSPPPASSPNPSNTIASTTSASDTAPALNQHASVFLGRALDAAASDDCDTFASSLEALAPDAKSLRDELVAAHQKFVDVTLDADLVRRAKAGELSKRLTVCDRLGSRAGKAIDATLRVVDPVDEYDSGNGLVRGTNSFGQGK